MLARIKSLRFFAYIAYQVVLVRTLYGTRTAHMFMGRNFGIWWARPPLFVGGGVLHPGPRAPGTPDFTEILCMYELRLYTPRARGY